MEAKMKVLALVAVMEVVDWHAVLAV